jgi:Family of unknown function (DUF6364)
MVTKLTLTIDEEVIVQAKKYAQKKNRSVSKIVEEYLKNVSELESLRNIEINYEGTLTKSIVGMFKKEYTGQSYDDLLESSLSEKYL